MTKYTSAPWEVSAGDIWPVNGNPRVKIATITKPSSMNGIDWEANAQLIASAPELLEALKELFEHGELPEFFKGMTERNKQILAKNKARQRAMLIIAKAEGK